MDEPVDFSESGAPIFRHQSRKRELVATAGDPDLTEAVAAHVRQHVGPVATSLHEVVSELVPIHLHVVAPTPARDFFTVVTSGMSARPMVPPAGLERFGFAELLLALPPDWPLSEATEFAEEAVYWPLRWLRRLARFPHEFETWLSWGHTVPNGDPPRPFAPDTKLSCMLLLSPTLTPPGFLQLDVGDGRRVRFYSLVPITAEELQVKLREGGEALEERLAACGVSELLDPGRSSVC